ncbi:response regulator transcription factor [Aquamicrobium sp. LC103]|uniref:response regulator transcription factor n=1 Tax=Aquamicrobium sp. LC103 TaxID=1120658 RepID=UPI001FEFAD7F|nr:response regulator transcription factor [Aquamicrobium sp. LC103]
MSLSDEFRPEKRSLHERALVLIDNRALSRECLSRSLVWHGVQWEVVACGSIQEWRETSALHRSPAAVLIHIGGNKATDPAVAEELRAYVSEFGPTPVVVLADADDLAQIFAALDSGVRGYIPASVGVEICVEAIKLALAGGVFVPASSVLAMQKSLPQAQSGPSLSDLFTPRQADVADALRKGKANKIIAYELNLCESTVKVHIRNIMRKLKATNRTEVAYKMRDLLPLDTAAAG